MSRLGGVVLPWQQATQIRFDLAVAASYGLLERVHAPVAVVAGDPCYDRLAASLPSRDIYRRALGVRGRKLVAVTSTWGPGSLLQRHRDLLPRLAGDLPGERYRVAAIVHPNVWHWHGPRQVTVWYADCVRRGLILVRPEDGWRGVLAASDVVIGDHGAVTCYATAGVPVLLASYPARPRRGCAHAGPSRRSSRRPRRPGPPARTPRSALR